jgi:thioredoxin reductase (NADPH)
MSQNQNTIAVIGSGPAGCTAAIYASRGGAKVDMYLGSQPGGQLTTTTIIENFPGFIDGIDGSELMQNMQKQAQRFGTEIVSGDIINIEIDNTNQKPVFILKTIAGSKSYDAVIISSGARAKYLGLPNEQKLVGNGVHTCATCDGFFYRKKTIAVVGGGDTAMEEANHLTHFADKLYLIHRRDEFRASDIMRKRVIENPKVELILNTVVEEIVGEEFLEKLILKNLKTNETSELKIDGLFVAIGHAPNTDFVKGKLDMDEIGYLRPSIGQMTSVEGIFTCGDVDDTHYRQAITAAGEGCKAAMDALNWLDGVK